METGAKLVAHVGHFFKNLTVVLASRHVLRWKWKFFIFALTVIFKNFTEILPEKIDFLQDGPLWAKKIKLQNSDCPARHANT